MKFNSKAGAELRTWILFFVGIGLAVIFAIKESPLNPWWTLVIGAFTSTAVIVSAVQSVIGGISDAARKAVEDAKRELQDLQEGSDSGDTPSSRSIILGPFGDPFICGLHGYHTVAI